MKKSKNAKHTKLIYLISNLKNHTVIITIIAFFLFGELVYLFTRTNIPGFHIKHFMMYGICSLAIFSSLTLARKLKSIEIDVATEPVICVPINRLVKLCYSPIAIIIGVIAGSSYLIIFILLQFVPINFVGVYSLILTAVDISLAAILLIQYMILVTFIFIISKKDIKKHHNYDVSKTTWLVELYSLANYSRNVFFILVTFMVLMFISFMPKDFVDLIFSQKALYPGFFPTIIYFSSVAVYDLVILPSMSFIQNRSFAKIVDKINSDIIKSYEDNLLKATTQQSYKYLIPIEYINEMSKRFLENRKGKFIPATSYIVNATSIFFTIFGVVKDLI